MKTIGIVGGLGPESTVDYYQRIIGAFVKRRPQATYPEIVVFSANSDTLFELVDRKDWDGLAAMLLGPSRPGAGSAEPRHLARISSNIVPGRTMRTPRNGSSGNRCARSKVTRWLARPASAVPR